MEVLTVPHIAFFVIIAIGFALGNIKIKGISLDVSAIIFVALIFGHYGIKMPPVFQKIGLILFIYSVGIQAGPGFFDSFKKQGAKLIALAAIVVISGALTTLGVSWAFNIELDLALGLFTGALTSTPGLAAAIDSTQSPLASIGYGIAYPFGVLGVIFFVRFAPKIFKVKIPDEEVKYEKEISSDFPEILHKNFVVENPNIYGKTIGELLIRTMTGTNISRVLQNNQAFTPTANTVLNQGDVIKGVGTAEGLKKLQLLIGHETEEKIALAKKFIVRVFLVTNKNVVNKSLGELAIFEKFSATATAIRRSGIDIIPRANSKLHFGDKVTIACSETHLPQLSKFLGDNRKKLNELDFLPISLGIILGVLIGQISLPIFGINFKLGLTGGILLSALILSKIGKTGNVLWNISGPSNQMIRRIGILFFLATVGTNAGGNLVSTLQENGPKLFVAGMFITIIPMVLCMFTGYKLLKVNFLTNLGALTGSMTSTPALSAIEPITESNAPQVAYATVYPFALVILILCSQILGML